MKNKLIFSLVLILTLTLLASCGGELSGGNVPNGEFTPATDNGEDSELYERYQTYKNELEQSFASAVPLGAECFEYEDADGGVKITKYVGEDSVAVIPESIGSAAVTSIAAGAFDSRNMRAIYIPDSVTDAECGALSGCNGLVTLRLPRIYGGFLGYIFGADEHAKNAISTPSSLDRIIIGEGVETVNSNAFSGCKSISAILLPDTLREIGEFAFYECGDLVFVHTGEGLEKIGQYAFATCSELYAFDCKGAEIELGAFYNCRSLNNIAFADFEDEGAYLGYIFGAKTADYSADFVPSSLRRVALTNCDNVPALAFAQCENLTAVTVNVGACSVGVRAFYGCASLTEAELPETVEKIGDDAFFGCASLVDVKLPARLTSLGKQAFMNCGALKSIILPEALRTVEAGTFYGCASLVTVDLGGAVRIERDAFAKCQRLVPVSTKGIEVAEGNEALVSTSGTQGK